MDVKAKFEFKINYKATKLSTNELDSLIASYGGICAVPLSYYDLTDVNFIGKDLNLCNFASNYEYKYGNYVACIEFTLPKGLDKAIFHDDPEINKTIIKMIIPNSSAQRLIFSADNK